MNQTPVTKELEYSVIVGTQALIVNLSTNGNPRNTYIRGDIFQEGTYAMPLQEAEQMFYRRIQRDYPEARVDKTKGLTHQEKEAKRQNMKQQLQTLKDMGYQ